MASTFPAQDYPKSIVTIPTHPWSQFICATSYGYAWHVSETIFNFWYLRICMRAHTMLLKHFEHSHFWNIWDREIKTSTLWIHDHDDGWMDGRSWIHDHDDGCIVGGIGWTDALDHFETYWNILKCSQIFWNILNIFWNILDYFEIFWKYLKN